MSDWPWVAASYALTWIVLGVYALLIHRRLARARNEFEIEQDRSNPSLEVDQ